MKRKWKKIMALAAIMLLLGSLPVMAAVTATVVSHISTTGDKHRDTRLASFPPFILSLTCPSIFLNHHALQVC